MSKENDLKPENPSAFPYQTAFDGHRGEQIQGMSLRDYFAAKAMPKIIGFYIDGADTFDDNEVSEWSAKTAYIIADAMLKEREKSY